MHQCTTTQSYGLLSFITGAALLIFELVAARILAPTIGSSTFVWTSVIGVIIAALSLGYFAGGKLADWRNRRLDLAWLLLGVALLMAVATAMYLPFLDWLAGLDADARVQGVIASLVLFAPTSFVLGAISPYLAKLNVTSLATSGNAVASLSALNSIGGIVGTFLTGFVLFGLLGSHQILLALLVIMLLSSWIVAPRLSFALRLALSILVVSIASLSLFARDNNVQIDTASSHYEIQRTQTVTNDYRLLVTGPDGYQSGIDMNNRDKLLFWYAQEAARQIDSLEKKDRLLFLGGGAFTLPEFIAKRYPNAQIDAVEIDPALEMIAQEYFGFESQPNLNIIASDARTFINQTDNYYDAVIVDVYGDGDIPFSFMTAEYGEKLANTVAPGGVVLVNAIAGDAGACQVLGQSIAAPYDAQFAHRSRVENPQGGDSSSPTNMILRFSDNPEKPTGSEPLWSKIAPATDNFAPIERLQMNCRTSA